LAVPAWAGGSEEVDEQLCDALGLVVMDPMRGVGQALDAVEVGHVIAVRLGELGAEVAIALPQMTRVGAEIGRSCAWACFD
jgi:hypothetical protein